MTTQQYLDILSAANVKAESPESNVTTNNSSWIWVVVIGFVVAIILMNKKEYFEADKKVTTSDSNISARTSTNYV